MIKTKTRLVEEEKGKLVEVVEPVLDRRSNEPIVTEDRTPGPFRALPRDNRDRILGNPAKNILGYEQTKKWLPIYQRYDNGLMVGLQCWKCGRDIVGWAPALRRPAGWKPGDADELVHVNGQPAVKITCFNHYREGEFQYVSSNGVLNQFTYLHCADCSITDGDGDDLLTCFLSGHDNTRNTLRLFDDDFWAQWMWRWSSIELVGRKGSSKGPGDLMEDARRGHAR